MRLRTANKNRKRLARIRSLRRRSAFCLRCRDKKTGRVRYIYIAIRVAKESEAAFKQEVGRRLIAFTDTMNSKKPQANQSEAA